MIRSALSVYRLMARWLLPAAFRREYGAELEDAVAARLAGRNAFGAAWVLAVEMADLLRTGSRERFGGTDTSKGGFMLDGVADVRTGARNLVRRPGLALGATPLQLDVIGRNLLDHSYRSFLSRYKLYAEDPGRNVTVRVRTGFSLR